MEVCCIFRHILNICPLVLEIKCALVKVPVSRVLGKPSRCHAGEEEVGNRIKKGDERLLRMQKAPAWEYCGP